jgi:hypothetical protein
MTTTNNSGLNRQEKYILSQREQSVQVRVLPNKIVDGHSPGTVYWTTPARARLLLDHQAIEVIGQARSGPSEIKPAEPQLGKSSDAPSTGHSTGSASSHPSGEETRSSASGADQASLETTLKPSELSASAAPQSAQEQDKSGSSQSTTPTSSRRGQTSATSRTQAGGSGTRGGKTSRSSRA